MSFDWARSPWALEVNSAQELFATVFNLGLVSGNRRYVWRGVEDSSFRVRTSIQRVLAISDDDDAPSEREVRIRERQLIDAARRWGLHSSDVRNDLALLAKLQHFGVPTRLLDVSVDPLVALWFACRPNSDKAGVLFAFDVTDFQDLSTLQFGLRTWNDVTYPNSGKLKAILRHSSQFREPILLTPGDQDDRMRAQGGRFLVGTRIAGNTPEGIDAFDFEVQDLTIDPKRIADGSFDGVASGEIIPFLAICIAPHIQEHVRAVLARNFSKSEAILFPDISGFAQALGCQTFSLNDVDSVVDETNRDSYSREIQRRLFPEEFGEER